MTAPDQADVDAYDGGRAAFDGGAEVTTCPFPADSPQRLPWVRGYVQARRDAELTALAEGGE